MNVERRNHRGDVELRKSESGGNVLTGYAAVYNSDSEPIYGAFIERLAPGCFDDALAGNPDVLCRMEHEGGLNVLGRTVSGTLRLSTDERGLRYEVDLPDTSAGRDTLELVKRGDIFGSSFAFGPVGPEAEVWEKRGDGKLPLRTIKKIADLVDVAPVSTPAYSATTVQARSLEMAEQLSKPEPPPVALDSEVARLGVEIRERE